MNISVAIHPEHNHYMYTRAFELDRMQYRQCPLWKTLLWGEDYIQLRDTLDDFTYIRGRGGVELVEVTEG
jgi:hypothetical protein